MASRKFATALHDRTNRITLLLLYAVLEWILITLLLFNSLFSYLILKFADHFGLERPCLWCSRVDRVIDPDTSKDSYRNLVCEFHAHEISKLGYCSSHRKLAESRSMCEDCSSSSFQTCRGASKKTTFVVRDADEKRIYVNGEVNSNCSCCDVSLKMESRYHCSPYFLIKPNWTVLDYTQKANLISEGGIDDDIEVGAVSKNTGSDFALNHGVEARPWIGETFCGIEKFLDVHEEVRGMEEASSSSASDSDYSEKLAISGEDGDVGFVAEKAWEPLLEEGLINVSTDDPYGDNPEIRYSRVVENASLDIQSQHIEYYIDNDDLRLVPVRLVDSTASEKGNETNLLQVNSRKCYPPGDLLGCKAGGGTVVELFTNDNESDSPQIPGLESGKSVENQNPSISLDKGGDLILEISKDVSVPRTTHNASREDVSVEVVQAGRAAGAGDVAAHEEVTLAQVETGAGILIERRFPNNNECPVEVQIPGVLDSHSCGSLLYNDAHEIEDDKVADKREWGPDESLDGSLCEFEASEGNLTIEGLKLVLAAKRRALNALYVELEEERNASAVAANQTMAMINRLQEEKAAMQMEALQYQRMMEEQSEYDQEALQLLNELMVKREREKRELEKELEIYQKKVIEYEAKERMKRSRTCTVSCSRNADDSDGLSIDLNQKGKEEDGFDGHQESRDHGNTPVDAILDLDKSFTPFEDERLLILEQLRILEEKLFSLEYEEHLDNGIDINGAANGFPMHMNGKHGGESKNLGLFEQGCGPLVSQPSQSTGMECWDKKIGLEEGVDHLYERLQGLEADREFMKHCVGSLKKGDKGMNLLREILQHLRDLRNVELQARSV